MRTIKLWKVKSSTACLVFALLFSGIVGCATLRNAGENLKEPRGRLHFARIAYSSTLDVLRQMGEKGKLSEEQMQKIDVYEEMAYKALGAWRQALKNNKDTKMEVKKASKAITKLKEIADEQRD